MIAIKASVRKFLPLFKYFKIMLLYKSLYQWNFMVAKSPLGHHL